MIGRFEQALAMEKFDKLLTSNGTNPFRLTWTDEDGDEVTIGSDEEMALALREIGSDWKVCSITLHQAFNITIPNYVQLAIRPHSNGKGRTPGNCVGSSHLGIRCNLCKTVPIVGVRYHCLVCPDFDLCGRCESAGKHPEHEMVRMPSGEYAAARLVERSWPALAEIMEPLPENAFDDDKHEPTKIFEREF